MMGVFLLAPAVKNGGVCVLLALLMLSLVWEQ